MTVVETAGGAFLAGRTQGGGLWTAYLPADLLKLLWGMRREREGTTDGPATREGGGGP